MGRPNILYTAFVAQDYFSTPVKKMGASVKGLTTITSLASAKMAASMASVSAAAMEIGVAGATIGSAIAIPLGLATRAAIRFRSEMSDVSTLVDTTVENMDDMGDAVLRVAGKIPKPVKELTESLYQIRSAGTSAADAMGTLVESGKLAVAGLGTVQESANMVTSSVTVFKKENIDAATAADILFKTVAGGKTKVSLLAESFGKAALAASDVGITFRELMAMTAAMTNTGVQTAEAQTAITQAMISLNKRTSEMVDLQETLSGKLGITGMEFIQWAGSGVAAMKLIDDYANKNHKDIFKIYGRKEGALADIALTRLQNKKYNELFDTMKGGNALNAAFDKQAEQAAKRLQVFKNKATALGVSVGDLLIPPLTKLVDVFTPLVEGVTSFAKNHKILAGVIVDSIAVLGGLAAIAGVVGLSVGAVTRATKLLTVATTLQNAAIGTYNFLTAYAAIKTGRLTGAVLSSRSAFLGARVALGEYNMELRNAGVLALALLTTMKAISQQKDAENAEKLINPFGLDFGGTANDNRGALNKLHATDEDFSRWQKSYVKKKQKVWEDKMDAEGATGFFNDPVGAATRAIQRRKNNTNSSVPGAPQLPNADSTRNSMDRFYENLNSADTGRATSANYVPKNAMQNITITLENNSGMTAKVVKNGGNTAEAVPIKIVSTTSRKKQATT